MNEIAKKSKILPSVKNYMKKLIEMLIEIHEFEQNTVSA